MYTHICIYIYIYIYICVCAYIFVCNVSFSMHDLNIWDINFDVLVNYALLVQKVFSTWQEKLTNIDVQQSNLRLPDDFMYPGDTTYSRQ